MKLGNKNRIKIPIDLEIELKALAGTSTRLSKDQSADLQQPSTSVGDTLSIDNSPFKKDAKFGPIELREYISAAMQEHKCLRDEILQRITARNYIIGLLSGFIVTLHVQSLPAFFGSDVGVRTGWSWVALVLLPLVIQCMAIYIVTNFLQIQRAAVTVAIIERKLDQILCLAGGQKYELALKELNDELGGTRVGLNLASPIMWERLLRSRKGQRISRWWDQSWIKIVLPLTSAFIASVGDGALAGFLGTLGWKIWLIACGVYLTTMTTAVLILSSRAAHGNWEKLRSVLSLHVDQEVEGAVSSLT